MGDAIPVRVFVRARPLSQKEKAEKSCLSIAASQITCTVAGKCNSFTFDGVLDPSCNQLHAYRETTSNLVDQVFKGFNVTILAYGQTGSGKTHTMGTSETAETMLSEERGIIPRLVADLFERIAADESPASFKVSVTMLEIHNDNIVDLLSPDAGNSNAPKKSLEIREHRGTVFVKDLTQKPVTDLRDAMSQLEQGSDSRTTAATAMNSRSSRSHAIFTILIEKTAQADDEDANSDGFTAKLSLVDLAGSERLKKTLCEGDRKKEGIKINEGLLALGNVISALSEASSSGGQRYIPYRDSIITRLLQDSLGGNAYTVMIACVSPAESNFEETLSTLRYADRTRKIKNKPIVNADPDKQLIKKLREEVAQLRTQLSCTQGGMSSTDAILMTSGAISSATSKECERLRDEVAKFDQMIIELQMAKCDLGHDVIRLEQYVDAMCSTMKDSATTMRDCITMVGDIEEDNEQASALLDTITRVLAMLESHTEHENERMTSKVVEPSDETMETSSAEQGDAAEDEDKVMADVLTARSSYLDRQAQLDVELKDIARRLAEKQSTLNEQRQGAVDEIQKTHETECRELNAKIEALEKEKAALSAEIKKHGTLSKLSEERRKKIAELQAEITATRRRVIELDREAKKKKDVDVKLQQLSAEISELKRVRTKLMQQQRAESQEYQRYKQSMDKKIAVMKAQERKRDAKQQREQRAADQKLAVLRQKLEETSRINKRLNQQLETRIKSQAERHQASAAKAKPSTATKDIDALEIDLQLDVGMQQHHIKEQIKLLEETVGELTEKLKNLRRERCSKKKDSEPGTKRSKAEDGSVGDESFAEDDEVETISKQITEFKQSITDLRKQQSTTSCFNTLKDVNTFKAVTQMLFQKLVEANYKQQERDEKIEVEYAKVMKERKQWTDDRQEWAKEKRSVMKELMQTIAVNGDLKEKLQAALVEINELKAEAENAELKKATEVKSKRLTRQSSSQSKIVLETGNILAPEIKRPSHPVTRMGVTKESEEFFLNSTIDDSLVTRRKMTPESPPRKSTRARKPSPRKGVDISPILDCTQTLHSSVSQRSSEPTTPVAPSKSVPVIAKRPVLRNVENDAAASTAVNDDDKNTTYVVSSDDETDEPEAHTPKAAASKSTSQHGKKTSVQIGAGSR